MLYEELVAFVVGAFVSVLCILAAGKLIEVMLEGDDVE